MSSRLLSVQGLFATDLSRRITEFRGEVLVVLGPEHVGRYVEIRETENNGIVINFETYKDASATCCLEKKEFIALNFSDLDILKSVNEFLDRGLL